MNLMYVTYRCALRVLFSSFFGLRVFGRENVPPSGPLLLVSNHQSLLDPILCGVALKRELDFMARDGLFHNKLLGMQIKALNTFPVQRDHADIGAIKEVIRRLQQGKAVTIFPEGTRSNDGQIKPFKSGFELIARRAHATTVPVLVDGAFDVWSRHRLLPRMGKIYVVYGKAISPEEAGQMPKGEYVARVIRQIRDMRTELHRRYRCQS